MMGSDILDDCLTLVNYRHFSLDLGEPTQSLIALNPLQNGGLFNGPLPIVGPLLLTRLVIVLLSVANLPPALPVIGELLIERGLDGEGLV